MTQTKKGFQVNRPQALLTVSLMMLSGLLYSSVEPVCTLKNQSYQLVSLSLVNQEKVFCRYSFKENINDLRNERMYFGYTQRSNLKTEQDFTVHLLAEKMGFNHYTRIKYYWCQSNQNNLKQEDTSNFTSIVVTAFDEQNKLIGKKISLSNKIIDDCLDSNE